MESCWQTDYKSRPTFHELKEKIAPFLEKASGRDYVELNTLNVNTSETNQMEVINECNDANDETEI